MTAPLVPGLRDEGAGIGDIDRQWLLAEDRLAGGEARAGMAEMRSRRGGDVDAVAGGQDGGGIGKARHIGEAGGDALQRRPAPVPDAGDAPEDRASAQDRAEQALAHDAGADDSNRNSAVGHG